MLNSSRIFIYPETELAYHSDKAKQDCKVVLNIGSPYSFQDLVPAALASAPD